MFSFLLIPLLTLLTALLHTANASAVPAPATTDHLSNRSSATPSSASPSSPSPSSPSPTDSADPTDPTAIRSSPAQISAFVNAHNQVRAQHHANPLKWSVSFARLAEQWADACNFRHTNGVLSDEPYGENIVAATGNFTVNAAVGTFFQDESAYFKHFTRLFFTVNLMLLVVFLCLFHGLLGVPFLYFWWFPPFLATPVPFLRLLIETPHI